ncbi:hypothetical protein ACFLU3_05895 [Chloroflexota bacterium]
MHKIKDIIERMHCPKNFTCVSSEFSNLCKAKDIGMKKFLVCLDEVPQECSFALDLDKSRYFCRCPLRVYVAKNVDNQDN